jgi:hypothetical protein
LWQTQGKYPAPGTPGWEKMPPDAQAWWADMLDSIQELGDCERYHCRPSELDGEDYHTIKRHRAIKAAERRYLDAEQESAKRRRR